MKHHRDSQAGFTLIETLVALTVLSVGSMTLLMGVERYASATRSLEDRIVARWVAENVLAANMLDVDVSREWTTAMGAGWNVRSDVTALPGSGLEAVTIRVAPSSDGPDASLVSLTGYLPAHGGRK